MDIQLSQPIPIALHRQKIAMPISAGYYQPNAVVDGQLADDHHVIGDDGERFVAQSHGDAQRRAAAVQSDDIPFLNISDGLLSDRFLLMEPYAGLGSRRGRQMNT